MVSIYGPTILSETANVSLVPLLVPESAFKITINLKSRNKAQTYVKPPRPIVVKKLMANRVSRGLSRGNKPSKAS